MKSARLAALLLAPLAAPQAAAPAYDPKVLHVFQLLEN